MSAASTRGVTLEPFWWDAAPRVSPPELPLPRGVEVAVIGSGYTGLSAALTLARAGRSVAVFEAHEPGHGGSSRNQGQIGAVFKRSFSEIEREHGRTKAVAVYREGVVAIEYLKMLIEREQITCHLQRSGRFVACYRPEHYEALAQELEVLKREVGFDGYMVPRAEQGTEIGSEHYYGGQVRPADAQLHSALYHQGLLDRVRSAGVPVLAHTPVTALKRDGQGFVVSTPRGEVKARHVFAATNGYTTNITPWLARRVIPLGAYGIATEELPAATINRLLPNGRIVHDTRKLIHGVRLSHDHKRIIFGGRASMTETDPSGVAERLRRMMVQTFPELKDTGITHAWMGFVAFTFDHLPHIGVHDGVHYAMGYCGSGLALGTYFGHKVALRILGDRDAATPFDDLPFETKSYYFGKPWFAPAALAYYRFQDALPR